MSRPLLGRAARGTPGRLERVSRVAWASQDRGVGRRKGEDREGSPPTPRPSREPRGASGPWNQWSRHSMPCRVALPLTPLSTPDTGTVAVHAGPPRFCSSLSSNSHLVALAGKLCLGALLNPLLPAPTTTDTSAQDGLERAQGCGLPGFRLRVTTGAL